MILIDFSNLTHRILFASILNAEKQGFVKKPKDGEKHDMKAIKPFFLHLLFTNLKYVKETFSAHSEEDILLCLDSSSWRKDFYPLYKSNRAGARSETNVNWEDFYEIVNNTIDVIKEAFPFKVVKVHKAEGDDIIATICEHNKYNSERTLIITEDKDFKQLLEYDNVQLYRPILKQFIRLTPEELTRWRIEHILGGDASDGIPTIKTDTEFTPEFIKYLEENNIFERSVHKFNKLEISTKLYDEYTGVDKYGKRNVFKAANFGEKGIQKFVETGLLKNLRLNPLYKINFKRNRHLIQFKYIPTNIKEAIISEYKNVLIDQKEYNSNKILEFFNENRLKQLSDHIDVFCPSEKIKDTSSLDDWF